MIASARPTLKSRPPRGDWSAKGIATRTMTRLTRGNESLEQLDEIEFGLGQAALLGRPLAPAPRSHRCAVLDWQRLTGAARLRPWPGSGWRSPSSAGGPGTP